ncbi:MAG: hypothetical protein DI570_17320 [Phenylobacterium zucineum]|nr:MAG: hypothetical protein DI570_17320 [Phenylobacterium zucineum]
MTSSAHIRSVRYLDFGASYVEAAKGLLRLPNFERVRTPFYGLLGHGLELGLKGVIARGGCDDEELMWLGHDLVWAWRRAQEQEGVRAGEAERVGAVIDRANSTRSWARIPRDGGHGFHGIVGAL